MYSKNLRFIAILISVFIGIWLILNEYVLIGTLLIIGAILLLYGYFRYASVWLAFRKLSANDFTKAKKLLEATPKPEWLSKSQRGYYYWGMGLINLLESKLDLAEIQLIKALNIGLKTDDDISMVYLGLAEINFKKGAIERAKTFMNKAENTPHKDLLAPVMISLKDEIYNDNGNNEEEDNIYDPLH